MKKTTITCPRCGAEYLPQEIYIPNTFFGKASYIEKDSTSHQITQVYGTDLDLEENYICDVCNTPFNVSAKISFTTKEDTRRNFNEEYETKLTKEKILLEED